jgi:methyl halide transferase
MMFKDCTWDERYKAGPEALPWDEGLPACELVEYFASLSSKPKRVLEIGCGTGTNAIWMTQQGSSVIATDISPTAIEAAKKKCKEEDVNVDLQISDIMVFDRGVFHVMSPEQREAFVDRVASALHDDGYWLCLAGNADQKRNPDEMGPPQLTATVLIGSTEGKFELHRLERATFVLPGNQPHLAWKALFKKRPK